MCDTCGCDGTETVELGESLLAGNDREAAHNREHLQRLGVLTINLMGSPGSGKTALLEATARAAAGRLRIAAVSGDLATDLDAERLERAGIPSLSITTGTACHLDARMVHRALHELDLDGVDVLFLENVGNLVCPSLFDLGQAANVVALSVTEGEDKPLKYPPMFARADLVVLTKVDLLPHLPVSLARFEDNVARVCPAPAPLLVSALTGQGVDTWMAWLEARRWEAGGSGRGASAEAAGHEHHDHHHHHHDPQGEPVEVAPGCACQDEPATAAAASPAGVRVGR